MPVLTVQLGQCGNQLGSSLFHCLASELSSQDYGRAGVEEYFRPLQQAGGSHDHLDTLQGGAKRVSYAARAVLIDMEPKVVNAACSAALSPGSWWRYHAPDLGQQSGSGNNWAQGFHGYGPRVHDMALDLIRREVEACDLMSGFVLLQSMAGGTGAGFGTYMAQALRDEYHSSHILNCCIWPYESGEVIVQSYNTLLTLSHLADLSDGIVMMENEALHRTCIRLYNVQRPSFNDLNGIAARALASMLLPCSQRSADLGSGMAGGPSSSGKAAKPGRSSPGMAPDITNVTDKLVSLHMHTASAGSRSVAAARAASEAKAASAPALAQLPELLHQLCCHPLYRLLTLRALPQVPPASVDFTTFSWPAITKRLKQMMITGSVMEEGMDWHVTASSSPGNGAALTGARTHNKTLASCVVLRGQGAGEVDMGEFTDPGLYAPWSVDPLGVFCHANRFNRCNMSAAMLSNDQSCVGPMRRMQERAYSMLASRAFVHQYEQYGLTVESFNHCFAHVEEIVERYCML